MKKENDLDNCTHIAKNFKEVKENNTLSDLIEDDDDIPKDKIRVKHVKEFIKRKNNLNEEIVRAYLCKYLCKERKCKLLRDGILGEMKEKGDKLAGDELI